MLLMWWRHSRRSLYPQNTTRAIKEMFLARCPRRSPSFASNYNVSHVSFSLRTAAANESESSSTTRWTAWGDFADVPPFLLSLLSPFPLPHYKEWIRGVKIALQTAQAWRRVSKRTCQHTKTTFKKGASTFLPCYEKGFESFSYLTSILMSL